MHHYFAKWNICLQTGDAGNHKRKASDGEHVPAGRTEGDDDQQQLTRGNDEEDISTPASVPPAKRRKVKAPIEPRTSTARDVKNQRPCLKVGKAARECHCGCECMPSYTSTTC